MTALYKYFLLFLSVYFPYGRLANPNKEYRWMILVLWRNMKGDRHRQKKLNYFSLSSKQINIFKYWKNKFLYTDKYFFRTTWEILDKLCINSIFFSFFFISCRKDIFFCHFSFFFFTFCKSWLVVLVLFLFIAEYCKKYSN